MVRDAAGTPLKNALVMVYQGAYRGWGRAGQKATNINGEALYDLYKGGNYMVMAVEKDGYYFAGEGRDRQPKLPEVGGSEWKGSLDVTMEPLTRTVAGQVLDPDDKPLPFANVDVIYGPQATADADGTFSIRLPASEIVLGVREGNMSGYGKVSPGCTDVVIKLERAR